MTKHDLIEILREKHIMNYKKMESIVNDLFNVIIENLEKDQEVKISGFGVFKHYVWTGRTGKHIKTGEALKIPTKKSISFKLSKNLKDKIN